MPYLQCNCGSFIKGIQLSRRVLSSGEYRNVEYKLGAALATDIWNCFNKESSWMLEKKDGVYCPNCHEDLILDPAESAVLIDKRIPGILSSEFDSEQVLNSLKSLSKKERAEIFIHNIPELEPTFGKIDGLLPKSLTNALERMEITSLYSHQAETYNAVRERKNVVLVTHTASGKTLSFNLPILQGLLEDPEARALYIFPTKALADDQVEQLYRWTEEKEEDLDYEQDEWFERTIKLGDSYIPFGRLDGDTQLGSRKRLLKSGRILFTNPDMIHHSFLKNVQKTGSTSVPVINLFKNLRYIVIDEMHLYRGAFGTHVSLVIRRLQKVCEELGNTNIQFILCSATIEKPDRLAEDLTGKVGFALIDNDGSYKRKRDIVFWNPGVTLDTGERKAPVSDALAIAEEVLVQDEKVVRTIMFQGSRLQGKITSKYMKDVLRKKLRMNKESVSGMKLAAFYNGMLAVEERKQVINAIKKSEIHLVITTNALEVGIDIGDLSFALLSGYPGSKAAFSQQIGRVGRKGEGIAVLIFEDEPLQQYYMQNPTLFLDKLPEVVRIDPQNKALLDLHLAYLQEELGRKLMLKDLDIFIREHDKAEVFLSNVADPLSEGLERCSLRSGSTQNYKIISTKKHSVLLEGVDEWTALRDFHEGAIYWNANEQGFRVDSINRKKLEILVTPLLGEVEYYTQSIFKDSISILEQITSETLANQFDFSNGALNIKRTVFGYKQAYFNSRVSENQTLDNPLSATFEAEGFWMILSEDIIELLREFLGDGYSLEKLDGCIRSAEHILLSVIPDTIICDGNDISGFSGISIPGLGNKPAIGFYGNQSGGMGTTKAISEHLERIVKSGLQLINTCSCVGGCPSCIQYPRKDNDHLSKSGSKLILELLSTTMENHRREVETTCL